ncbi:MAG: hypothetical protein JWP87_3713 [Labilithrix sp.]|nr:hypothetical protein [Labilithrix sp.]
MANPQTTHVIEIETGIGEPAFIPLSMGHELQPISVGKKGMWRIESPRVLDVHAFVYFDGTSLFLQSADDQNAASVDGYRVGKAWTELHAPCKIEVGTARLRYRSLIADADNQPTMMAPAPPVQLGPGGPGSPLGNPPSPPRPGAGNSMPVAVAPAPPAAGSSGRLNQQGQQPVRAPVTQVSAQLGGSGGGNSGSGSAPIVFPKAERPFKPGEFASPADLDESTRIAPLDATGGGRIASGSHPRPAAGQPAGDDPSTRPEATRALRSNPGSAAGSGAFNAIGMQSQPDMMGGAPGMNQGYGQQQGQPPQGYPPQQQGYAAHGGYSNSGGSGAFNALGSNPQLPGPPGMPGPLGPSMPPGGYGSMTPQGMQQPNGAPAAKPDLAATLKTHSIKIIGGTLLFVGAILFLIDSDEPAPAPKKPSVASADGGAAADSGTAASTGAGVSSAGAAPTAPPVMQQNPPLPAWPAGFPCPPPNWPPNTPLPCTPNGISASATPDKPAEGRTKDGGKTSDPKDAGAPLAPGTKTLARQAVDAVAAGDTARAAAAYEELARRDPNDKVFAEAARILRAKLDGGLPGQ